MAGANFPYTSLNTTTSAMDRLDQLINEVSRSSDFQVPVLTKKPIQEKHTESQGPASNNETTTCTLASENPCKDVTTKENLFYSKTLHTKTLNGSSNHPILSGNISSKFAPVSKEYPGDCNPQPTSRDRGHVFDQQSYQENQERITGPDLTPPSFHIISSKDNRLHRNYHVYADLTGPRRRDPLFQPPAYSTCSRSFLKGTSSSLQTGSDQNPDGDSTKRNKTSADECMDNFKFLRQQQQSKTNQNVQENIDNCMDSNLHGLPLGFSDAPGYHQESKLSALVDFNHSNCSAFQTVVPSKGLRLVESDDCHAKNINSSELHDLNRNVSTKSTADESSAGQDFCLYRITSSQATDSLPKTNLQSHFTAMGSPKTQSYKFICPSMNHHTLSRSENDLFSNIQNRKMDKPGGTSECISALSKTHSSGEIRVVKYLAASSHTSADVGHCLPMVSAKYIDLPRTTTVSARKIVDGKPLRSCLKTVSKRENLPLWTEDMDIKGSPIFIERRKKNQQADEAFHAIKITLGKKVSTFKTASKHFEREDRSFNSRETSYNSKASNVSTYREGQSYLRRWRSAESVRSKKERRQSIQNIAGSTGAQWAYEDTRRKPSRKPKRSRHLASRKIIRERTAVLERENPTICPVKSEGDQKYLTKTKSYVATIHPVTSVVAKDSEDMTNQHKLMEKNATIELNSTQPFLNKAIDDNNNTHGKHSLENIISKNDCSNEHLNVKQLAPFGSFQRFQSLRGARLKTNMEYDIKLKRFYSLRIIKGNLDGQPRSLTFDNSESKMPNALSNKMFSKNIEFEETVKTLETRNNDLKKVDILSSSNLNDVGSFKSNIINTCTETIKSSLSEVKNFCTNDIETATVQERVQVFERYVQTTTRNTAPRKPLRRKKYSQNKMKNILSPEISTTSFITDTNNSNPTEGTKSYEISTQICNDSKNHKFSALSEQQKVVSEGFSESLLNNTDAFKGLEITPCDFEKPLFSENSSKRSLSMPSVRPLPTYRTASSPEIRTKSNARAVSSVSKATFRPTSSAHRDTSTWSALLNDLKSLSQQDTLKHSSCGASQEDIMEGIIRGVEELVEILYLPPDRRSVRINGNSDHTSLTDQKSNELDTVNDGPSNAELGNTNDRDIIASESGYCYEVIESCCQTDTFSPENNTEMQRKMEDVDEKPFPRRSPKKNKMGVGVH
ncbi:hypothetical protein PoB_000269500 [Plakobranchus ocellatus]|uniref:WASP family protein member n=1 Tax=Plakobranchus ocellatus TaxID=259542 RepID=A0AAV3XZD1_9GAST|nr:hypothetical protein PoB_000269500 [Plakobranchus ocellatus]